MSVKVLVELCPYCRGFTERIPFLDRVSTNNIENGWAVVCEECGFRGMVANSWDRENAIVFWNEMAVILHDVEERRIK